jgi:colicin import membrane protein
MNAHSTSAYSLSMMLHGAFLAALLFTAFAMKDDNQRKATEVFELVAGEGNNWAATEAPALGTPTGVKFQPAPTPVTKAKPEPVAPPEPTPVSAPPAERSPIAPVPVQAVTAPKPEPKKIPEKTFAQQLNQTIARRDRAVRAKLQREAAAREKREAAARAKAEKAAAAERAKQKTMSLEEFQKQNGKKVASAKSSDAVSYEKVSTRGISTGVSQGTGDQEGASGKALNRAEQDAMGTYFEMLKQKVRAAHVSPPGVSDQLSARVSFYLAASGSISHIKILRSSGDADFDQSVINAFTAVGSIGARPDRKGNTNELEFKVADTE